MTDHGGGKKDSGGKSIEISAGGVVVRASDDGWTVLIIRDPYGNWGLPKGHLEGEETLAEAAAREVAEETGIQPDQVGPLVERIDWYFRRNGRVVHKFCSFFLMRSDRGEAVPQLEEGITDCAWVSLAEAPFRIAYDNTKAVVGQAGKVLQDLGW